MIATNATEAGLSAWENEGGALAPDWTSDRMRQSEPVDGQQILKRLGSGVVAEWKNLPNEIQRGLFNSAASTAASCDPARDKEQIARFLHTKINEHNDAGRRRRA